MGTVEVDDQAAAARWLQKQPYVDPNKIAISGWSYGGYMTLKMLEKAPNGLYAAGVVGAPVTKWELYDTTYTERYLGNPSIDPKPYQTSDALADAAEDQGAVPAPPRHVGRQCRVRELIRCSPTSSSRPTCRST